MLWVSSCVSAGDANLNIHHAAAHARRAPGAQTRWSAAWTAPLLLAFLEGGALNPIPCLWVCGAATAVRVQMLHDMCRQYADNELAPNAAAWDKADRVPADVVGAACAPCVATLARGALYNCSRKDLGAWCD